MNKFKKLATIVALSLSCFGCAVNQGLYEWGSYQGQVYSFLKGEPPEQQVVILEKQLADTKAAGKRPPPGFYAHLGLLYSKIGRDGEVAAMFEMERAAFPESNTFLQNVVNGFRGLK